MIRGRKEETIKLCYTVFFVCFLKTFLSHLLICEIFDSLISLTSTSYSSKTIGPKSISGGATTSTAYQRSSNKQGSQAKKIGNHWSNM